MYELVASHFVSYSDNGASGDEPPLPVDDPQTVRPYPRDGFGSVVQTPAGSIRITPPSQPLPFVPEATNIPFRECKDLLTDGPPEGERSREVHQLRRELEVELREVEYWMSLGGPQSTTGVVSIGFRYRYQPSIDWLIERADAADVCLELPPVGHYDRPSFSGWRFFNENDRENEATTFVVVLSPQCGLIDETRLLEPVIEYHPDEILVGVPIRPRFGPQILPCYARNNVEITLTEPRNGRPVRIL